MDVVSSSACRLAQVQFEMVLTDLDSAVELAEQAIEEHNRVVEAYGELQAVCPDDHPLHWMSPCECPNSLQPLCHGCQMPVEGRYITCGDGGFICCRACSLDAVGWAVWLAPG